MFDQLFSSAGWYTTVCLIFCWNIGYNSFKCFSEKVTYTVVVRIQAYQTFPSSRLFSLGKGNIELNRKIEVVTLHGTHEIMGGPEVPSSGFRFIHVWKGRKENSRVGKMTIIYRYFKKVCQSLIEIWPSLLLRDFQTIVICNYGNEKKIFCIYVFINSFIHLFIYFYGNLYKQVFRNTKQVVHTKQ